MCGGNAASASGSLPFRSQAPLGLTGFLLLARELGLLFVTGEWTAQSVGLALTWLGLTAADGQSWIVNLMLGFPISWLLVLVSPVLF